MAATDFIWARNPLPAGQDLSFYNAGGSAIAKQLCVKLDTANLMGASQGAPAVVVTAASTDFPLGVTAEQLPASGFGRVQVGGVAIVQASGAITAGAVVMPAASGQVQTQTAGKPQLGQALNTTANAADPCAVLIHIANNA
jgi:hypothetical protein